MKRTQEVVDYENEFDREEFYILALTGANGFGGGKIPSEEYWNASISLIAWKREDGGTLERGDFLLATKADDERMRELRELAGRDQIIRVKVRQADRRFLITEDPEAADDPELAKLLEEETKVVLLEDDVFGTFTLNRTVKWFETKTSWMGSAINLSLDQDDPEVMADALKIAKTIFNEQTLWDEKIRRYASDQLLETKNDNWLDDDESELTTEEFMKQMGLQAISVTPDGEAEFWFEDGDMFWGHSICVSVNLDGGSYDAGIVG